MYHKIIETLWTITGTITKSTRVIDDKVVNYVVVPDENQIIYFAKGKGYYLYNIEQKESMQLAYKLLFTAKGIVVVLFMLVLTIYFGYIIL